MEPAERMLLIRRLLNSDKVSPKVNNASRVTEDNGQVTLTILGTYYTLATSRSFTPRDSREYITRTVLHTAKHVART